MKTYKGKQFVYNSPYGGVTKGIIKDVKTRTDLNTGYGFVVSENGNCYRLEEIKVL